MEVELQNENLVAREDGRIRALVPDLITIMDRETADTITTEKLKYGQRVTVVAAAAPSMLREAAALRLVGPGAFGLGTDFAPLAELNRLTTGESEKRRVGNGGVSTCRSGWWRVH